MPRQPYSVAVLSTGGRLHPLSPEGKGAWGKRWSPPWLRRDGVDRKRQHCRAVTSFPLMVKGKAWLGVRGKNTSLAKEKQAESKKTQRDFRLSIELLTS